MLKIWIWCLCKANHKDNYVQISGLDSVKVNRGQFIFGRKVAAKELDMHESLVYRAIKRLQTIKNITVKSNNKYSVITITNYDRYQSKKGYDEQLLNNSRTTAEQQLNTNNNVNNVNNVNNKEKEKKFFEKNNRISEDNGFANAIDLYITCQSPTSAKKEWDQLLPEEHKQIISHAGEYRKAMEKADSIGFLPDFSKYLFEKMYNISIKKLLSRYDTKKQNLTPKYKTL
jgi:hypothetical protein